MISNIKDIHDRARTISGYRPLSAGDRGRLAALVEKYGSGVLNGLYKTIAADPELAAKITVPLDDIERRQTAHVLGLIKNSDTSEYPNAWI